MRPAECWTRCSRARAPCAASPSRASEGFLQPYDEATAALAAAADRARSFAEDDLEKTAAIAEQERIAERWAGIANDAVIRIRNGRPISAVSTASRNDLIESFEKAERQARRADRGGAAPRGTQTPSSAPSS